MESYITKLYHCATILKYKKNMTISKIAKLALKGMSREQKDRIAAACGVQPSTVYRWIANDDASLTMAAVLKVIREETGLTDAELLEEPTVKERLS